MFMHGEATTAIWPTNLDLASHDWRDKCVL
jgi:hypothetical protein